VRVSAGSPPSGVLTFLFTDIEGSTRRWEADADAMRVALLAHDEILRSAIEEHGGFLFSHTGDGVVAAFASPRCAVDAAIAAQRALELPVRMGLATGEAELRDGDYFGTVLNRAARVMAAGHGGQILVADSTAGLLNGVDLLNLGPRRLRDVPNPITVYQLQALGLSEDFPPLRGVDSNPGNLRPATTSLIGRDVEVSEVQAALRSHRLVTLTGVGGVGKTRLGLEVATQLADEFVDGVWVFELAAVADPAAVPDAVAAVLGIVLQPGKTVGESVASALEGRSRLLVFDNCEHVVDAVADLLEAILAASSTVKVLTTSREGIGVADEQLWRVPSLDVGAAVKLFVERAQSMVSDTVTDETMAVEDICRRLDGIPLAIELAASRMASMTASEVRDRLDDRFKLLVGSRRGVERHQTLRQAVAWSYDLLDDAEKSLLARCSVFSGGFDLQSACAVAGSDDPDDYAVLDLLDALVRKSLLVTKRSSGRTRFSMLETIRQFAEEQLVAHGEATLARTAHARHFAGREPDILAVWDSPRQRDAYEWFDAELANLRAGFRWAADNGDLDAAAAIAFCAAFLGWWLDQHEPGVWAEELLEPAKAVGHRRLAQLYVMASLCYLVGRSEDALRYSEAGQAALHTGLFDGVPYDAEVWSGVPYLITGAPGRCVEMCRVVMTRAVGSHTYAHACMVVALTVTGAHDEAVAASAGLIDAARATDNPAVASWALLSFGYAHRDYEPAAAYDAFQRGLKIARDTGNRQVESSLADSLARLAAKQGEPMNALDLLTAAIRNFRDSGGFSLMTSPLAILAALFDRLGRHEPAATISGFAITPLTQNAFPEINTTVAHLREVLGDETYESLARKGVTMTNAAMAQYAFDQIDQARAELNGVS
jgi:predicted ATPase/class 3 adenylate cyclase